GPRGCRSAPPRRDAWPRAASARWTPGAVSWVSSRPPEVAGEQSGAEPAGPARGSGGQRGGDRRGDGAQAGPPGGVQAAPTVEGTQQLVVCLLGATGYVWGSASVWSVHGVR